MFILEIRLNQTFEGGFGNPVESRIEHKSREQRTAARAGAPHDLVWDSVELSSNIRLRVRAISQVIRYVLQDDESE